MSLGGWFRAIIKRRTVKQDKPHEEKVDLATEKYNGSLGRKKHIQIESNTSCFGDLSRNSLLRKRSLEDVAATRIQSAFRAFMARKNFKFLKGAEGFHGLLRYDMSRTRTQASNALSYIHSWNRMQNEVRTRRLCMVSEYTTQRKKLENQSKLDAKLHELEVEWCGGSETMEEIVSRIHHREEAAVRRERAMAYAFSHQWRANSILHVSPACYSLEKENWGWSWKQRWIAARPWEIKAHAHPTIPKKVHTKHPTKSTHLSDPLN